MYTVTFYKDDTIQIYAKYIREVGVYTQFEDCNGVNLLMVKTCDVQRIHRN